LGRRAVDAVLLLTPSTPLNITLCTVQVLPAPAGDEVPLTAPTRSNGKAAANARPFALNLFGGGAGK